MGKRVLVAPLNWGMGHATRSIPLIRHLIQQGHEVTLASDGEALTLLCQEFPHLTAVELASYDVTYPLRFPLLFWMRQGLRIRRAIRREKKQTRALVENRNLEAIISDNRYGVYQKGLPSVLITHQFRLISRFRLGIYNRILRALIRKFDIVWIPDDHTRTLTGDISQSPTSIPVKFLGPLSRLEKASDAVATGKITAVLSGPEPTRSIFEQKLRKQLAELPGEKHLVRGTQAPNTLPTPPGTKVYDLLTSREINQLINSSELIISRNGYTTLMDLTHLGKPALLVPTPLQPEQQYLGEHLRNHPLFVIQKESELDLKKGIAELRSRIDQGDSVAEGQNSFHQVVDEFLDF